LPFVLFCLRRSSSFLPVTHFSSRSIPCPSQPPSLGLQTPVLPSFLPQNLASLPPSLPPSIHSPTKILLPFHVHETTTYWGPPPSPGCALKREAKGEKKGRARFGFLGTQRHTRAHIAAKNSPVTSHPPILLPCFSIAVAPAAVGRWGLSHPPFPRFLWPPKRLTYQSTATHINNMRTQPIRRCETLETTQCLCRPLSSSSSSLRSLPLSLVTSHHPHFNIQHTHKQTPSAPPLKSHHAQHRRRAAG
jgi:hypothetical protein